MSPGRGCQRVDDGVVPGSLGQQRAFQFGPCAHGLEGVGFVPVGGAGRAGLDVVLVPAVLEVDDRQAGGACGVEHGLRFGDRRRRAGDVEAGDVDIASGAGIGVLHIDHDHRGFTWFQAQRFRPGRQGDAVAARRRGRCSRWEPGHSSGGLQMLAGFHQRLDAGAEILGAFDEVVECQQNALASWHGRHLIEQARRRFRMSRRECPC